MGRVDSSCADDQFANSFLVGGEPVAGDKTKTLGVPDFVAGTAPGSYAGGNYPYATPFSPYADSNWQHTPGAPMSSAQVVTPADSAASGGQSARKAQQRKSSKKNRETAAAAKRALAERAAALETENASLKVKLALLRGAEVPDHVGGAALEAKNAELEDQLAGAQRECAAATRENSALQFQVSALKMQAAGVDAKDGGPVGWTDWTVESMRCTAVRLYAAGRLGEVSGELESNPFLNETTGKCFQGLRVKIGVTARRCATRTLLAA